MCVCAEYGPGFDMVEGEAGVVDDGDDNDDEGGMGRCGG